MIGDKVTPLLMTEARTIAAMSPILVEVLPDCSAGEVSFTVSLVVTPLIIIDRDEWIKAHDKDNFLRATLRNMIQTHRDACDRMLTKLGAVG
jgi:hypothetical protein